MAHMVAFLAFNDSSLRKGNKPGALWRRPADFLKVIGTMAENMRDADERVRYKSSAEKASSIFSGEDQLSQVDLVDEISLLESAEKELQVG
jgi:hypothetical protein